MFKCRRLVRTERIEKKSALARVQLCQQDVYSRRTCCNQVDNSLHYLSKPLINIFSSLPIFAVYSDFMLNCTAIRSQPDRCACNYVAKTSRESKQSCWSLCLTPRLVTFRQLLFTSSRIPEYQSHTMLPLRDLQPTYKYSLVVILRCTVRVLQHCEGHVQPRVIARRVSLNQN